MKLCSGLVWCQAVSMMAHWGTPGMTFCAASIPMMFAGLWRGPRSCTDRNVSRTSGVMTTDLVNLSPPCRTRCPTDLMTDISEITPILGSVIVLRISSMASLCVGQGLFISVLSPFALWVMPEPSAPMRSTTPEARTDLLSQS